MFEIATADAPVRDENDIKSALAAMAQQPNGALIVPPSATLAVHRALIIELAGHYRLPAVYPFRYFAAAGGLISYGVDQPDLFRQAAGYIDQILRGAKRPADLPVQSPRKFEMVINLKAAKAIGIEVPALLLTGADEVIE